MFRLHSPELAAGAGRERRQLEDWCFANINYLMNGMGLTWGWWCALNLPRAELFGERISGDVDLLAGPLELTISQDMLDDFIRGAQRQYPGSPAELHLNAALVRAGREGFVQWPPEVRHTVAVEVKASYFVDGRWKATHRREHQKILGALRRRRDLGINAVAFVHLGVVAPVTEVSELHSRADNALRQFPFFNDSRGLEGFGYLARIMGSIVGETGAVHGLEDGPGWIRFPTVAPETTQPWHDALRVRLALLPRPEYFRTYVHRCGECEAWRHARSIDPDWSACACRSGLEGRG